MFKLAEFTLNKEYSQIQSELTQIVRQPGSHRNDTSHRHFSIVHLVFQLCRFLQIQFVSDFRSFISQIIIYVMYIYILSTIFDHRMVKPSGCYLLDEQNSTCTNELDNDSLLSENINYLGFCLLLVVLVHMCTSAVAFAPLVKVFRNEHRNSRSFHFMV